MGFKDCLRKNDLLRYKCKEKEVPNIIKKRKGGTIPMKEVLLNYR